MPTADTFAAAVSGAAEVGEDERIPLLPPLLTQVLSGAACDNSLRSQSDLHSAPTPLAGVPCNYVGGRIGHLD
jgi:hypothetical protein